jgi:hypothetical protein
VLLLNVGGLLDFVGAFATGILTSNSSLGFLAGERVEQWASLDSMPLSLIPFAVPLWIILHLMSLLQLRAATSESSSRGSNASRPEPGRSN